MSYLRFCPDEYRALCLLADQLPLSGMGLPALQQFLVACLPLNRLDLAKKIDRLDRPRMRLLYEHLRERGQAGGAEDGRGAFSDEELQAVARVCDSFRRPVRFLWYYRDWLVEEVRGRHPALARKLARLGERQFARLYEQLKGRRNGNA